MICLTREVRFSVDRDWAGHVEFSRPITNSWGGWPSAVGIVPYLRLSASVAGRPDPRTGFVCNISVLDELLRRHAIPLTAAVLRTHGWRMSAERLLRDLWMKLVPHVPRQAPLVRLELGVTPFLSFTIESKEPAVIFLTQQFEFSAAHRLHCAGLGEDENREIFGKCNNPRGHGHNYVLAVTICGEPDERTGALLPLPAFEQLVQEVVIERLDHKHLNEDTVEFRDLNPTIENISHVIWSMLAPRVAPARLHTVRVWETPKTSAEYRGGAADFAS